VYAADAPAARHNLKLQHAVKSVTRDKENLSCPRSRKVLNLSYKEYSVDYLVWAIPATLWLLISLNTATWQKPLLLLEHTHQR
jgi:hypothetical protein